MSTSSTSDLPNRRNVRQAGTLVWPGLILLLLAGAFVVPYLPAGALPRTCLFQALTHLPCPLCGCTRGLALCMHGHFQAAWHITPLSVCLFAALLGCLAFFVIGFFKSGGIRVSKKTAAYLVTTGILVALANWLYLLGRVIWNG